MLKTAISLLLAFMPVVYRRCFSLSFYSLGPSYLHATYILVQKDIPIKRYLTDFYHFFGGNFLQKKKLGILTGGPFDIWVMKLPHFFWGGGINQWKCMGDFEGLGNSQPQFF